MVCAKSTIFGVFLFMHELLGYEEVTPTPPSDLSDISVLSVSSLYLLELHKLITQNSVMNAKLGERVQFLESTINELKINQDTQMKICEEKYTNLKMSMILQNNTIKNISEQIHELETSEKTQIKVSAEKYANLETSIVLQNNTINHLEEQMSKSPINFDSYYSGEAFTTKRIIKFDKVTLNTGNGYDPFTGLFTAPISGYYSFHSKSNTCGSASSYVVFKLRKKNATSSSEISLINGRDSHTISDFTIIRLETGDQLFVELRQGNICKANGGIRTKFGGFLIQ